MTSACRAMIDYTFYDLCLNRIEIRARTNNNKSRAIPERLGFTEEGILRQEEFHHNQFHDLVVYGIVKSEWKLSSDAV